MRLREGASLRVMGDALYDNCLGGLKIGPGMQVVGNFTRHASKRR